MMRQELLQTVIKEEEKLKQDMSFQNIELQYLENFLKNNKVHKLTDLKDIDVIHLIIVVSLLIKTLFYNLCFFIF